jgi:hypothetical protein
MSPTTNTRRPVLDVTHNKYKEAADSRRSPRRVADRRDRPTLALEANEW